MLYSGKMLRKAGQGTCRLWCPAQSNWVVCSLFGVSKLHLQILTWCSAAMLQTHFLCLDQLCQHCVKCASHMCLGVYVPECGRKGDTLTLLCMWEQPAK